MGLYVSVLPLALEAPLITTLYHHFFFFFSFACLASSASCWSLANFIFFFPSGVLKNHSWGGREVEIQFAAYNPPLPYNCLPSSSLTWGWGESQHSRGLP